MSSALDWFFRNRQTGEITIGQWPNLPLIVFLACIALELTLAPAGQFGAALKIAGRIALAAWALDEIARGVNPWRRCLGGAVLLALAYWALA